MYTKGEWIVNKIEEDLTSWYEIESEENGLIADTISTNEDAQLIASAPDLLEALKDAHILLLQIDIYQDKPDFETKILKAINKAEGRS